MDTLIPYSLIICGCLSSCRYWISLSTRPAMSLEMTFLREMILSATSCPLTRCTASLTFPNDPSPRVFFTLYCPIRRPMRPPDVSPTLVPVRWEDESLGGGLMVWGRGPRRSRGFDRDIESSSSSIVEAILLLGTRWPVLKSQWRFLLRALALRYFISGWMPLDWV